MEPLDDDDDFDCQLLYIAQSPVVRTRIAPG